MDIRTLRAYFWRCCKSDKCDAPLFYFSSAPECVPCSGPGTGASAARAAAARSAPAPAAGQLGAAAGASPRSRGPGPRLAGEDGGC